MVPIPVANLPLPSALVPFQLGHGTLVVWKGCDRIDPKNVDLLEEVWRGIIAHPPGCESLALTFDGQGHLCRFVDIPGDMVKGPLRGQKHYLCFPLFCKTTGEMDQHIAICVLLRMLRDKYFKSLKVEDGTGYFKSNDLEKLKKEHRMMAGIVGALNSSPAFLTAVLKAAGVDEEAAKSAVPLDPNISLPSAGAKDKGVRKKAASVN